MTTLRTLAAGAALAVPAALLAPTAAAADPGPGTCPVPFTLRAVAEFGPNTQAFLIGSVDRTEDGLVCAKALPDAVPFLPIDFIDNRVRGGQG